MPIPASDIVVVTPGVIAAGGNGISLNGLLLSKSAYLPANSVQSFASTDAVAAFFGSGSSEAAAAQNYFLGFDNSTVKPDALYFGSYSDTPRFAWLQGGALSVTLAQLQAFGSGTLSVTVSGTLKTSSSINLAAATSFSNAAALIQAAFTTPGFTVAWDAVKSAFIFTTTTGGAVATLTECGGTLAFGLKLSSVAGAILSQGTAADTAGSAMDAIKSKTSNWVSFATMWEASSAEETAFAVWTNAQGQRFVYVAWDTDPNAATSGPQNVFGVTARSAAYDAVMPLYVPSVKYAAFTLGLIASIDFSRRNARITAAFKSQSGLTANVSDQTVSQNLLANGYSFYGAYAAGNDNFTFLYNGQITGKWGWLDTFVNQVWLNSKLQAALLSLLASVGSIPYTEQGYTLIRAAMADPIQNALRFGAIRAGVALSTVQKAQVAQSAGVADAGTDLEQKGFYLQVLDPGATVRQQRGTPVINLWYCDGGAVQQIKVSSVAVL